MVSGRVEYGVEGLLYYKSPVIFSSLHLVMKRSRAF